MTERILKKRFSCLPVWSFLFLCGIHTPAQSATDLDSLLALPLEDLMNVEVSLASRTKEQQFNVPAAVYVLSQEDIRRSGHRRLPEILRLIPGLHVAKIDANKWAVTSRNSLSRFSSTMLVMIDGRHIYSPFYAGVYWESQDTFIEDIDHIEVVRGPGGSLWGTNAVDGIINVITKSSADTQGTKAYALAGLGEMKYDTGLRYGGQSTNAIHYRVFAKAFKTHSGEYVGPSESTNSGIAPIGDDGNDDGNLEQAGFRMDWGSERDSYAVHGNAYSGDFNEDRVAGGFRMPNNLLTDGHNLAANWKRQINDTDSFAIHTYYAQNSRDDDVLENDESTFEIDLQHSVKIGKHQPVWGLGFRYYDNDTEITAPTGCTATTPCFAVDPSQKELTTWSAFVQDRISITETFAFIIGSKFENNDYTGFEYQPTLRGLWTPDQNTSYWGAVTRAVRVPDRVSTDGILHFGTFTVPIGNKDEESFVNYAYELGYRKRLASSWAFDGSAFYSDYRNTLQGSSSAAIDNVYGLEAFITHKFGSDLRIEWGYTYNEGNAILATGGDRPRNRLPENTLLVRSYYELKHNMELDTLIYYTDKSPSLNGNTDIPAYTRVDIHFGWRPTKQLDASILLTNLFDDVHAEGIDTVKINTGTNRGLMVKLTYSTDK